MANQNNGPKTWAERKKDWAANGKVSPNFGFKTNKQGKKTPYIAVPAAFVTLPQDAHVIQRKTLYTNGKYNGKKNYDLYVLCAGTKHSYTSRQTNQPVTIQNWYVARMKYYGGKPGVAEWLYQGTNERDARKRFAEIPYHKLQVAVIDEKHAPAGCGIERETYKDNETVWAVYKSNGTFGAIVANRIQRRANYRAYRASQGTPTQSPRANRSYRSNRPDQFPR
ncbi:MAG: hypothetical protein ACI30A_06735 [Paludibacteraceae bacterium]